MDLYFVTGNENKLNEVKSILGADVQGHNLDLREIQSVNLEPIAQYKARQAYDVLKKPVVVEDTGLFINSLNGFPGALIKWMLKSLSLEDICRMMRYFGYDHTAVAKTVVCYYDGTNLETFAGEVQGIIVFEPRGDKNFGWDPIFSPLDTGKTFAEMSLEEKNKYSMRRIAFEKLKDYFNKKVSRTTY